CAGGDALNLLLRHRAISNFQSAIDDRESLAQLAFGNAKRRVGKESIPAHKSVQAFLTKILAQLLHFRRSAVEGRQRLESFLVTHQFDDAEQTDAAGGPDRAVTSFKIFQQPAHYLAHVARFLD